MGLPQMEIRRIETYLGECRYQEQAGGKPPAGNEEKRQLASHSSKLVGTAGRWGGTLSKLALQPKW